MKTAEMLKTSVVNCRLQLQHFTNGISVMEVDISELKRVKELEDENSRLKRMYANLSLVHEALKDAVVKKAVTPD